MLRGLETICGMSSAKNHHMVDAQKIILLSKNEVNILRYKSFFQYLEKNKVLNEYLSLFPTTKVYDNPLSEEEIKTIR